MRLIEYIGYTILYAYCLFGFAYFIHKYFTYLQSNKLFNLEKDVPTAWDFSTILALTNIFEEIGIQQIEK
jgi:hypothetical protein